MTDGSFMEPHSDLENGATPPIKMNGKPVLYRNDAKTVLNMTSKFSEKELSTGPVLNLGDACGFGCVYCSSPSVARKFAHKTLDGAAHDQVVMRRPRALELLEKQLAKLSEKQKNHPHIVFTSSLVDIAANKELMRESAQAFTMILKTLPNWGIRTLTKSTLSKDLVEAIPEEYHRRILWGISIGILDDAVAKAIEVGTPSPTLRFKSLHWLQDNGQRTYAMACPSLPMRSEEEYREYAEKCRDLFRYDQCEDVFAEVINGRDGNFGKTVEAAAQGGLTEVAWQLGLVGGKTEGARENWEAYARATFEAHAKVVPSRKLRYLQYVQRKAAIPYWKLQKVHGAVLLGRYGHEEKTETETVVLDIPAVPGTEGIRKLLEANRGIEAKLKRKSQTLLASWAPNAIKIGEFFSAQKEKLPHGQYLNWLTTNFKIDRKTASNYVAVYDNRELVLEEIKCGTVPHLTAAYGLVRKANRLLEKPAKDDDQLEAMQDEIEIEESAKPKAKELVDEIEEVVIEKLPVLVMEASEEMIGKMLATAKECEGKLEYQVIRDDGQIRLTDYFAERLALKAA